MNLHGVLKTGVPGMNAPSTKPVTNPDDAASAEFSKLLLESSVNMQSSGEVAAGVPGAITQGSLAHGKSLAAEYGGPIPPVGGGYGNPGGSVAAPHLGAMVDPGGPIGVMGDPGGLKGGSGFRSGKSIPIPKSNEYELLGRPLEGDLTAILKSR